MFNKGLYSLDRDEEKILSLISSTGAKLGIPLYVVGGFVRDKLLGRPCKDIDIVCQGDGIALANEWAGSLRPIPNVNIFERFGTAMVRYGDLEIEFVGARRESYERHSRKPIIAPGSIHDDQLRRDFTINALSISLNNDDFGEIIDPFHGLQDLKDKIIKTPANPDITFSDDPLRMMRAIRFSSQLQFSIDELTWEGIKRNADRIKIVSRERISTELHKIILSKIPSRGFKLLFDSGLLQHFLPELCLLHGVAYQDGRGHKDNFYHTLQVLDNLAEHSDNLWLRWAALLHDIAKPQTKRFDPQIGWTFHGHEALGATMVPRIFKNLRMPLDHKMKYVQKLVRLHLRPIALTQEEITDSALRRLLFEAGPDLEDLLTLCEADITSKNAEKVRKFKNNYSLVRQRLQEVEELDKLRAWQPPISGEEIMEVYGLPPSKEIGVIKSAIREAILEGEIPNDYDAAFVFMENKAKEMGLRNLKSNA